MRQLIILVILNIWLVSVLSFVRNPRSEAEEDLAKRGILNGLPAGGTVESLVNTAASLTQGLVNNPLATVKGVAGSIPMLGGTVNGVLNTATDLVGGLPAVGGILRGGLNNPVGTVQGVVGRLPIAGGLTNNLLNTAGGLVSPQGLLFGLVDNAL